MGQWKIVRSLIQIRIIKNLNGSMSTRSTSIFKDPNVAKHLSLLHDTYVVSADKAPNNIVFVCKSHYVDCLINELCIDNSLDNPIYTPTTPTKEEILDNHRYVLCSFGISTKDEELDLPSLYIATWFLNYTSVLSCSVILLVLPNAPRNLFPNY